VSLPSSTPGTTAATVRIGTRIDWRTIGLLLAVFVAVVLLWDTVVILPLKIFVVLLHEVSHGIAAVLTGGSIERIEINQNQGGVCWTRGGNRFLTLSAGYLGSMFWGALLLTLASRTRLDRWICLAIGLVMLAITALYVRPILGFGFAFGLLFSAGMALAGWKLPERGNDLLLKVIGITSCLYAVLDIVDDVLRRPGIGSDADMLAQATFIPGVIWGVLWIALSLAVAAGALWVSAQGEGRPGIRPAG
jgi:hypothetical protein